MSGKSARARRRRVDSRQYQVVLWSMLAWRVAAPGACADCHRVTDERRTRCVVYDSGFSRSYPRGYLRRPDFVASDARMDQAMREMNARQREGDFGLLIPARLLCRRCALKAATNSADGDDRQGGDEAFSGQVYALATMQEWAELATGAHTQWMAFVTIAEPGADGAWRSNTITGDWDYDPARLHRSLVEDLERGGQTMDTPTGLRLTPIRPAREP